MWSTPVYLLLSCRPVHRSSPWRCAPGRRLWRCLKLYRWWMRCLTGKRWKSVCCSLFDRESHGKSACWTHNQAESEKAKAIKVSFCSWQESWHFWVATRSIHSDWVPGTIWACCFSIFAWPTAEVDSAACNLLPGPIFHCILRRCWWTCRPALTWYRHSGHLPPWH